MLDFMQEGGKKTAVVIANTGSPQAPTPEAVGAYLQEFLMDPRICPLPSLIWKQILNKCILPKRSVVSAEKYGRIWKGQASPLEEGMQSLSDKLDAAVGDAAMVRHAMSYGSPSMEQTLSDLRDEEVGRIAVIPLYPQSAFSTTRVIEDKLREALSHLGWDPEIDFVENYWERGEYIEALVGCVRDAGFEDGDMLLFAFHSIPMRDVRNGDTYPMQAKATAANIASCLGVDDGRWAIGFQCRFDSRKWMSPFTTEVIDDLCDRNPGARVFVIAPNFSVDCLESLYDIDILLQEQHASKHSNDFIFVPCLNDSDAQVRLLEHIVSHG